MAIESLGISMAAPVTVRRIDLAAELCFIDAAEGLAFLNACARALHLPRLRQVPYPAIGEARLESIVWRTPKGKATRIKLYDAGSHHAAQEHGERLRLEREQRWNGAGSPTPEQVMGLDLAALYRAPMERWLAGTIELRVSTHRAALDLLYDHARRGVRTRSSADMLGAKVNALTLGSDMLAPRDRRRREKALRDEGIVLDHSGDPQSRVIDLRPPLAALGAAWASTDEPTQADGSRPITAATTMPVGPIRGAT